MNFLKRILVLSSIVLVLMLAGCGTTSNTTGVVATATPTQPEVSTNPTLAPTTTPTQAVTPPTATPTTGTGPGVILTPTPIPGGGSNSQLVTLADRTLAIESVSQQPGSGPNTTAITLVLKLTNTASRSILNQASFYLLVGSEGDMFGYQSSASPAYYGTIAPGASRSGTLVFQIPSAAVKGLRLLFRPEVVSETVFVQLNLS